MLTQGGANCRNALSATLVAGLVTLPFVGGFAVDQEPASKPAPKGEPSTSAQAALLRGRVTDDEGVPLADVRVRVAIPAADMRFVDASTPHKQREAQSDAEGNYRLGLLGITGRTTISIDAMKPGYRRLVGTLMAGGDPKSVEVEPGKATEASLVLKPALYFAGTVVDEQGNPISGVKVSANANTPLSSGGVERTASNADGSFELFNYSLKPFANRNGVTKGVVSFFHPDYIARNLDDVYALAPGQREALHVVLTTGRKLTGTVFDVAGKPVPDAMVKVTRQDGSHRKATMTDANGKFTLRGLSEGPTKLSARALEIKQKILLPLAVESDKSDLEVRLEAIPMPADLKPHTVLGMQLANVTPELRSAYDLYHERGALILDPGKDSDRLNIGRLAEGYCFWMVGNTPIGSVREFVSQILAETAGQGADLYRVRVVYTLGTLEFDGTNTQYLKLTKDDLKQLQLVLDQLTDAPR
jgi:protocatechuate 3,4-dioxygenase beta subunit